MHIPQPPKSVASTDLTYNAYLKVPELLKLQQPLAKPAQHDEMLFIIIHQVYELWFKLMLHELEGVQSYFESQTLGEALRGLQRTQAIWRILVPQIHLLETMAPEDFLKFRDHLNPASGFQSLQYRELEFFLGARDERFLKFFEHRPEMLERLKLRMEEKSLWDSYQELMEKCFSTELKNAVSQMIAHREKHIALYAIHEAMIDFDQQLGLWREHHMRVVERIIGHKPGTGGSSGVDYLKTTTAKKAFQPLWDARTEMHSHSKY